eukprot:350928-Chlamydomonas_euryale.AAC.5
MGVGERGERQGVATASTCPAGHDDMAGGREWCAAQVRSVAPRVKAAATRATRGVAPEMYNGAL